MADAEAEVQKRRAALTAGDAGTASELRTQRLLDRELRYLEEAGDNSSLVAKARERLERTDASQIGFVATEFAAYLDAKGAPTDWVDPVIAQAAPEYAQARDNLATLKQAQTITRHNGGKVRQAIKDSRPVPDGALADASKYNVG